MRFTMILLVIIIIVLIILLVYSMCKAASDADLQKLFDSYKYKFHTICGGECEKCDNNDWCKFSDVKVENEL